MTYSKPLKAFVPYLMMALILPEWDVSMMGKSAFKTRYSLRSSRQKGSRCKIQRISFNPRYCKKRPDRSSRNWSELDINCTQPMTISSQKHNNYHQVYYIRQPRFIVTDTFQSLLLWSNHFPYFPLQFSIYRMSVLKDINAPFPCHCYLIAFWVSEKVTACNKYLRLYLFE
jgi:hypothetical protein